MSNDVHESSHAELEQSLEEECLQISHAPKQSSSTSEPEFNSDHQMSPEEENTQSSISALGAEELFTHATVNDLKAQIERLKEQISNKVAILKYKKKKFRKIGNINLFLKCILDNLLTSMYPEDSNAIMAFLGDNLNEPSSSYVAKTKENSKVIEILISLDLVVVNPCNKNEVKLKYIQ